MKNPTRINLDNVRRETKDFLAGHQTEEDQAKLHDVLYQYLTNGPTDEINKRSVNMIDKRLRKEFGMTAGITSGQPTEEDAHRGSHIGATVTIGEHEFNIDSYVLKY
ncbi:hypothetical protein [Pseudomonas palleroniana]|uniref:hypothetical protein n=1 Tax=Pseudomonas palleroniana TaxID=191390 RepID=UPI0018E68FEF|nr:hypothetical protein [Pseudomonas palleroniana]MBI6911058.1 hypothetical protein [Pseudomonas palleroniana]